MTRDIFDLTGKTAFITGAASGLGFAMAEAVAERGAHVCLADMDQESLERAVNRLMQSGHSVEGALLDVREPAKIQEAIAGFAKRQGQLDIAVANAGITGGPPIADPAGQIEAIDLATMENVIRVNQLGAFATVQAAAVEMKAQRSGRIIVTTSIAGMRTSTISGYSYSMTKAAVIHLVHIAALELAPYNIRVNGIAPGPFLTNIAGGRLFREPERQHAMAETTALKRIADPSELKGLALLLASEGASYITGQVIPIDGGSTVMS
jgi:NAD(P)-dependent dehydrogenase (short-subunit alcohol dehydrogenase family)